MDPILGPIIGGALDFLGGQSTNSANRQIAAENRAFQRQMSNTAYQRGTRDMRKAGINPMLAYSKGGADTPSGSVIPMENPLKNAGNAGARAGEIMLAKKRLEAEIQNINSSTALNLERQNTERANQTSTLATARYTDLQGEYNPNIWSAQAEQTEAQVMKIFQETANLMKQGEKLNSEITIAKAEAFARALQQRVDATDIGTSVRTLERLGIPMSGLAGALGKTSLGRRLLQQYGPWLGLGAATGSVYEPRPGSYDPNM